MNRQSTSAFCLRVTLPAPGAKAGVRQKGRKNPRQHPDAGVHRAQPGARLPGLHEPRDVGQSLRGSERASERASGKQTTTPNGTKKRKKTILVVCACRYLRTYRADISITERQYQPFNHWTTWVKEGPRAQPTTPIQPLDSYT